MAATSTSLRLRSLAAFAGGERFVLVQAHALHQHSLGSLDELSILEGLAQVGCLVPECLELLEPPGRNGDGGSRSACLIGLTRNARM